MVRVALDELHARFDQTLSDEGEAKLRAWHEDHPQGKHGQHSYQKKDIGVPEEEILERFGKYMDRYDLGETAT